jgi:hypothetical protein
VFREGHSFNCKNLNTNKSSENANLSFDEPASACATRSHTVLIEALLAGRALSRFFKRESAAAAGQAA